MTSFDDYMIRAKATDETLFLGQLCWYSVTEAKIPHQTVVQSLLRAGLTSYLPRLPGDIDAFRRVCTANQRKRVQGFDPNVYNNYLVRKIGRGTNLVARIVREEVDSNTNELLFDTQLCLLSYDEPNAQILVSGATSDRVANDIASKIVHDFQMERGMLNGYNVRETIRRTLRQHNATNVGGPNGGLYFVSKEHADTVSALISFAKDLGPSVSVNRLPLVDDMEQREMVRKAYESDSVQQIDRMIEDIVVTRAELKKADKKPKIDAVTTLTEEMFSARRKAKEYAELLQTTFDTTNSKIVVLQRLIMEMSADAE